MNQEKIGKFILKLRKENKLTQKEFADRLNVTAQAVSKWENGRGIPDIENLQKISQEFNVNIDSILQGEQKRKTSSKKYILVIVILLCAFVLAISYLFLNKDSYDFSDIKSTSTKFEVKGVAAYSKEKSSIYISDIEYLDGDKEEEYIGMECILYERHDNLEEKVSQCGSLEDSKETPKTLSELLTKTEFKVDNFTCSNSSIKNSNLYISINLLDTNGKVTTYKVPLELTGSCN